MIPIALALREVGRVATKPCAQRGVLLQAVAGLTHGVKLGQTRNINTCTDLLMPWSGQLPFLGSNKKGALPLLVTRLFVRQEG